MMALTHPAHQVHFEGITDVSKLGVESKITANSVIKAYTAKDVYGVTDAGASTTGIKGNAVYTNGVSTDMLPTTTVGMFYPGAVYEDAAGQKQLVAKAQDPSAPVVGALLDILVSNSVRHVPTRTVEDGPASYQLNFPTGHCVHGCVEPIVDEPNVQM